MSLAYKGPFVGIDQWGNEYQIKAHPRKELLEALCAKHADKIYVDTKDGKVQHVGYCIAGHWITVFKCFYAFK